MCLGLCSVQTFARVAHGRLCDVHVCAGLCSASACVMCVYVWACALYQPVYVLFGAGCVECKCVWSSSVCGPLLYTNLCMCCACQVVWSVYVWASALYQPLHTLLRPGCLERLCGWASDLYQPLHVSLKAGSLECMCVWASALCQPWHVLRMSVCELYQYLFFQLHQHIPLKTLAGNAAHTWSCLTRIRIQLRQRQQQLVSAGGSLRRSGGPSRTHCSTSIPTTQACPPVLGRVASMTSTATLTRKPQRTT